MPTAETPAPATRGRLKSKYAPKPPMAERITRYHATDHSCTCPDHRFRKHDCKHIRAVREALDTIRAAGFQIRNDPA